MVLLATFAQLRFGELVALRRHSIDLDVMGANPTRAFVVIKDSGPKVAESEPHSH